MFWARSDPNGLSPSTRGSRWQPLALHLREVGRLAEHLAQAASPDDSAFQAMARQAGLLHDIGKYAPTFQRLICGEIQKDPGGHAARGAALVYDRRAREIAFAIVGHHSGMPNPNSGTGSLLIRVEEARETANALLENAIGDCPEIAGAIQYLVGSSSSKWRDLHTRMLFSCLVDADRLDSASRELSTQTLQPEQRLESLLGFIERRAREVPEGPVKEVRAKILEDCLAAGSFPENLLSMTVPTGGGKTLSSLALALKQAIQQPDKVHRIIVVIPYLSIIEQNAQVFADALGPDAVLEHHSGNFERLKIVGDHYVPDPTTTESTYRAPWQDPATENWDAPIIVTTSVRFFESLFSNRPSDLRRLHNVARSVVILDEVQTLPRRFLNPLLSAMRALSKDWNTTFLFCTATQPAFEKSDRTKKSDPRWLKGEVREVIRNSAAHFHTLKRVSVDWQLERPLPWTELARRMLNSTQALAIVNVREHAALLFAAIKAQSSEQRGIFHLSTRMCAAHRLRTLAVIRGRIKAAELCLVASTQLVEAGVDLDFPAVFRVLGPFDSIVQAAGRCDREGKLTAKLGEPGGKLTVFRSEDGKTPPHEYSEGTEVTANMAMAGPLSIHDPAVMTRYFHRYYGDPDAASLGAGLEAARDRAEFQTVADEFRMINDYSQDVIVPYDKDARESIAKLDEIGTITAELRRKLQRYVVGLRPHEFLKASRGAIRQIRDTGIWVCIEGFYDKDLGIVFDVDSSSMIS